MLFALTENRRLSERMVLMTLTCQDDLPVIKAGQFAEVRVDGADVLLRRPLSIHDVDYTRRQVMLLVQTVGRGTRRLAALKEGEEVDCLLPLGHGFTVEESSRVLLVGGGVGVAPLLHLGKTLRAHGCHVDCLLGARTASELVRLDAYGQLGTLHLTTDDGSAGLHGLVTAHPVLKEDFNRIYVCGPTPMMKAVAAVATERGVPCEVSLENHMACGIGACLCCVTRDHTGHHRRVCTEGPVFEAGEVF